MAKDNQVDVKVKLLQQYGRNNISDRINIFIAVKGVVLGLQLTIDFQ